ncbi:MAG: hypothetical protein KGN76_12480 [Acidobacteriota bacterium]|nr:hypothetical protein [Acidobacteriota bacterium]
MKAVKQAGGVVLAIAAVAALSALAVRAQEMRNIRTYIVHVASADGRPVMVDGTFWVDGGIPHARVIHQTTPFDVSDAGSMASGLFAAAHGSLHVTLTIQDGGSATADGPMVAIVEGLTPALGQGLIKTFQPDQP